MFFKLSKSPFIFFIVASRLLNFCFKSRISFLYLVGVLIGIFGDTRKLISERIFFDGVISTGDDFGMLSSVSVHDQTHELSLLSSSLDNNKGRFLVGVVIKTSDTGDSLDIEAVDNIQFFKINYIYIKHVIKC